MANRTVREHLKEHHSGLMKLHKSMAADHAEHSEAHGPKTDMGKMHKLMADHHEQLVEHNQTMLEACDGMASKSMIGSDLDKIVPDKVSGITTHFPTMVPRFGAPQRSEKPNVPVEFEKLVSVEEDD